MFPISLKVGLRHLLKDKITTSINLTGLTIGLAAAILIGLYVLNEWQTDRSLPQPDQTFRLLRVSSINQQPYNIAITSAPFAPAIKQDYPEIKETVRVLSGNSVVTIGNQHFQEDKYYYADPNFFTFFGFRLLSGNPATVLSEPRSIVLSRETAIRYFGDAEKAVGKLLRVDNQYDGVVTGVFDDLKSPTHFDFDIVESLSSYENEAWWTEWWNNNLCTYLRLTPGTSASGLERKLPAFMDKYFGKDFAQNGHRIDLRLQPLRNVYFEADTRYDPMRHGDRQAVGIFFFSAVLLLVIACANYINLSTARAVKRSKEVGVYKVFGSGRGRIVGQLLGESLVLTFFALGLAVVVVMLSLPKYSVVFGTAMRLDLSIESVLGILIALGLAVALAAGLYPGWFLSSFRPAAVLKGNNLTGERHTSGLRKTLVVFQFMLSVALLCSTIIVRQQLDYLKNKNLGFDKEHVLLMNVNNQDMYSKREAFRQRLLQEPGVQQVTFMNGIPGGFHDATTVSVPELNQTVRMRTVFADFNYAKTFGLQVIKGRDFDPHLASDSTQSVLLNERALTELGLTADQILGKKVSLPFFDSIPRRVVGVVKDYHFASLHNAIEPLVISTAFRGREVALKVQGNRLPAVIAAAEKAWNEQAPAFPFTYRFLDEHLNRLYQNETRQGRIFALFAGIAIFIACLGMFGLAAFAASIRTKEIGVRKVLGASVFSIVALLSRDFLKLVLIAIVMASPLAWYVMNRWLQNFTYKIDINWWVFSLAGLIAVGIALLTVSFQSIKAALMNPVKSLRSE